MLARCRGHDITAKSEADDTEGCPCTYLQARNFHVWTSVALQHSITMNASVGQCLYYA